MEELEFSVEEFQELEARVDAVFGALKDKFGKRISKLDVGGSMHKGTQLKGLSDIDIVMTLSEEYDHDQSPLQIMRIVRKVLNSRFPDVRIVLKDKTVNMLYKDITVQIIPAFEDADGRQSFPNDHNSWSPYSDQGSFPRDLEKLCRRFGTEESKSGQEYKVLKVIKMMKYIESKEPEALRMSGYHIEDTVMRTLSSRKKIDGCSSVLLQECLLAASEAILQPTRERSGQMQYIDSEHGDRYSQHRQRMSSYLMKMAE